MSTLKRIALAGVGVGLALGVAINYLADSHPTIYSAIWESGYVPPFIFLFRIFFQPVQSGKPQEGAYLLSLLFNCLLWVFLLLFLFGFYKLLKKVLNNLRAPDQ